MTNQQTFLLHPVGSAGDVYPFLGLGQRLKQRGHRVVVLTSGYFQPVVERLGFEFVDVLSRERFLQMTDNPLLWHPWRGAATVLGSFSSDDVLTSYRAIEDHMVADQTVLVSSALGFAARMAHDSLKLPFVTLDLQPFIQWSRFESPRIPGLMSWAPPWMKQLQFNVAKTIFNRLMAPKLAPIFERLKLPAPRSYYHWVHSPQRVIGLYPDWYAPPQPDWPSHMRLTDFPLWNENADDALPADVEQFLREGEEQGAEGAAPIVFTPGSANCHGNSFFVESAAACERLKRRGMLFTKFPESVPKDLPPGVQQFSYAPFTKLLPRAAAIVHHGGIGTTSAALVAGIPQMIMPLAHDQPDNLWRLKRLGVADGLKPRKYRAAAVAATLKGLLESDSVRQSCRAVAKRFEGIDPYAKTVSEVEAYLPSGVST